MIGWQPCAFKLAARDRWIDWSAEQQFRRLHLVANNSRFVILTPERVPNLASRVLGRKRCERTTYHIVKEWGLLTLSPRRVSRCRILNEATVPIGTGRTPRRLSRTRSRGHPLSRRRRRCAVVDLSAAEWDGYANLHGRRQAMRIEREREIIKTGKRSIELTWSLTSLGAERAGPEELLALVRNHWHITVIGELERNEYPAGPLFTMGCVINTLLETSPTG